jgi:hypothetical protein
MVNGVISTNKEVALALQNGAKTASTHVTSLQQQLADIKTKVKASSLKSLFHGLIREGKMTKAEYKCLDLVALSALDVKALEAVTKAYTTRKPSAHTAQLGQEGADPIAPQVTPKNFKALAAEQLKGKRGAKNLADGSDDKKDEDKKDEDKKDDKDLSGDQDDSKDLESGDVSDIQALVEKCMQGIQSITESVESFKSYAQKLQVDDKKEEELASADDDSDEGDNSSDDDKNKDK